MRSLRNTSVWLLHGFSAAWSYRIIDEQGREYPFVRTDISSAGSSAVLTPRVPLPYPGTYRVQSCDTRCVDFTTFTVRDELDVEPPGPWAPRAIGEEVYETTGPSMRAIAYEVPEGAIAVADVDGAGRTSPLGPGAKVSAITSFSVLYVGDTACQGRTFAGEQATVRFGLLDLAGNFSGFGPSTLISKPAPADDQEHGSDDDGGCAVASRRGDWWPLLLLGLLALRQPRPRRTGSRNARSAGG